MNRGYLWWRTALVLGLAACGGSGEKKEIISDPQPNSSFVLRANVSGLDGQLILDNHESNPTTINSNGMTILPGSWSQGSTFDVRVKEEPCFQRCVVSQSSGNIVAVGSLTLDIHCESKRWDIPSSENDAMSIIYSDADRPTLAMNKYGDALLSWFQSDSFNRHLFKREFINRKWSNLGSIVNHFSFDGSNASDVSLVLNENMDAAVAWAQMSTDGFSSIYVGDKTDSTWTYSPSMLNVASQSASENRPVLRMNASGDKILVWTQKVGAHMKLFKSEYRNGSWNHPANVGDRISVDGSTVEAFDAAMNDLGETVITWNQSNGTDIQIFRAVYRNGGWTFPTSFSSNFSPNGTDSQSPRVAMNNASDIYITWYQKDSVTNGKFRIYVSESHDSGLTWNSPDSLDDSISPNGKSGTYPKVVVNGSGKVAINYRLQNGSSINQSYVILRSNSTSNWVNKRLTAADFSEDQGNQAIDMDEYGNIVAAWSSSGNGKVYKAEYRNGAWLLAEQSSPINSTSSVYNLPSVAVNNCRSAIAWQQEGALGQKQIFMQQYR
jgi:hypothetical protein